MCSRLRIIDAQPPRGNPGHQDELQARGGRRTHFLTVCVCVCVWVRVARSTHVRASVEITGVWGLLVGGV